MAPKVASVLGSPEFGNSFLASWLTTQVFSHLHNYLHHLQGLVQGVCFEIHHTTWLLSN
jgi:hypothetical protein